MDYFVPNFGADEDTEISQFNLAATEKKLNHTIKLKTKEELRAQKVSYPLNYKVEDYG